MSGGEQDVDVIIEDPDQEMGKQALEQQVCAGRKQQVLKRQAQPTL